MDESGGFGLGDDTGFQLNKNEAISSVADEGFDVKEEDDDYEYLYSDINVGVSFINSLESNNKSVVGTFEETERKTELPQQFSAPEQTLVGEPASAGTVGGPVIAESGVKGFETQEMRGSEISGTTNSGLRVELGRGDRKVDGLEQQIDGGVSGFVSHVIHQAAGGGGGVQGPFQHQQPYSGGDTVNLGNEGFSRGENMNFNGVGGNGVNNVGGNIGAGGGSGNTGGGGTMLFVCELHWWTTDAELEAELCKYGVVKEVDFFDEKASGKSKGYCQVEFYDPGAAKACKEGMNGHKFNGRPCFVSFTNPFSIKSTSEQPGQTVLNQPKQGPNENEGKPVGNNIAAGGNYQGGEDNSRGGPRGGYRNWVRGNSQGMGNRGGGPGGMWRGGRGIMGNAGNAFHHGMGGNPLSMRPQGFDPAFGGPMGRMGSYGRFPGGPPMVPFPGMMQPFHPGMPGVAPHVNPTFFGRGMPMNGMRMDRPNMGMWQDHNMARWGAEDHLGKGKESSNGDDVASDPRYDKACQDRDGWQGNTEENDRGPDRHRSVSSDRKYKEKKETEFDRDVPTDQDNVSDRNHIDSSSKQRDERDINRSSERELSQNRDQDGVRERGRDMERSRDRERERERERKREREHGRDRYKKDRAKYADHHRHRDHKSDRDFNWEERSSSRTHHNKSRYDNDRRPRSRDTDTGKKRRLTSE